MMPVNPCNLYLEAFVSFKNKLKKIVYPLPIVNKTKMILMVLTF